MIHWLVQIAAALVYPLNLALALAILGGLLLWVRRKRIGAACLIVGLLVLIVFSLPLTAGLLVKSLERRHLPIPVEQMPPADAIVVLGGGVRPVHPPRLYPGLTSASGREFHAARLFQAGKAPRVIVSGGPGGGQLLQGFGVPAENIIEEEQSRNTRENALHALEIMRRRGDIDEILLVTSAMHMPRALATFRFLDIDAIPAPTDYHVAEPPEERRPPFVMNLLPTAGSLQASTRAIHEYLGILYYRLRGWI